MIIKRLKTMNAINSLYNDCETGIKRIGYSLLLLGCISINQSLFCQDVTGIKASASGNLNCINTLVTLNCSSDNAGVSYKWSGPNGYVSTAPNPATNIPGVYTISVTNPATNTISTAKVTVALDTAAPAGVTATASSILTCKDTLITLTGSSTTKDVSYSWQGPEGFISSQKNTAISVPGIYLLTVTNPVNGCSAKANVTAIQNIKPPEDVNATVSGALTCKIKSVTLNGMSSTKGVNYAWKGAGSSAKSKTFDATAPGIYELEVTNPLNGCKSEAKVTVHQRTSPPEITVAKPDTLTCKTGTVKLTASSATSGTVFEWSGPDNIVSSGQALTTGIPGTYRLKVINPENECTASKEITVIQDTAPPKKVEIVSSGMITCSADKVSLTCSSADAGISCNWTGPEGFKSSLVSTKVSKKGTYYVEAVKKSNGCRVTESIVVSENTSPPEGVEATSSGKISCETPKVKITGKSTTDKVTFAWTGPDGFKSDLQEPVTSKPGNYTLTVTDPANKCKAETSVTVAGETCPKTNK